MKKRRATGVKCEECRLPEPKPIKPKGPEKLPIWKMLDNELSRGRPKKPDADRRTSKIEIRVTGAERKLLEEAAHGQPLSTWLRELGLREAKKRSKA